MGCSLPQGGTGGRVAVITSSRSVAIRAAPPPRSHEDLHKILSSCLRINETFLQGTPVFVDTAHPILDFTLQLRKPDNSPLSFSSRGSIIFYRNVIFSPQLGMLSCH